VKSSRFRDAFREAGSFVAGLLIGLSIVVAVFAMMAASSSDGETLWIFGAFIILAFGVALQVVATTQPGNRRTTRPELGVSPVGFMPLFHER
jgi:cytochrome c biogenesis protein CcdA